MLLLLIFNICFCFFVFVFGFNRKGWVSYNIVLEEIKDVDYTGTDV